MVEAAHQPTFDQKISQTLDEAIARRVEFLTAYQSRRYARRYARRIEALKEAEAGASGAPGPVTEAAARGLFKMMAIKDEYEVARLYTDGSFMKQLSSEFGSWERLEFHLAPPILGRKDARGNAEEVELRAVDDEGLFGACETPLPARARRSIRSRTREERKAERRALAQYEATLDRVTRELAAANAAAAAELLAYPDAIRGYGHVRRASMERAEPKRAELLQRFEAPAAPAREAAE